jgi:hypothetical protein
MRLVRFILPVLAILACVPLVLADPPPKATPAYRPSAVYCAALLKMGASPLCPYLPGDIGPDPALQVKSLGYQGIMGTSLPTSFDTDVETPFDNYSWQAFVALNWKQGANPLDAKTALKGDGPRVWQSYSRVSAVFGNSAVQANCHPDAGETLFSIGSNGDGTPATRNEEYIQASTGDPVIDVNGNWALYERRLNNIEIAYLRAPGGNPNWNLTTYDGQKAFVAVKTNQVGFPSVPGRSNGAIEIKTAWRILGPKDKAEKFFVQKAMLAVAPDLVYRGAKAPEKLCAHVVLGMIGMHIIQKNPKTANALLPQWFWTTFEHVDNAPLADAACDINQPGKCGIKANQLQCPATKATGGNWSFFDPKATDVASNQPPAELIGGKAFVWKPEQPYAGIYLTPSKAGKVGTQVTRCWQIYKLTQQINAQWQGKLHEIGSVFANYALIGTQWGANTETTNPLTFPAGAVPAFLSNSILETYLQNFFPTNQPFNTGSCISCHKVAALTAERAVAPKQVLSDFSFLPGLVAAKETRRAPIKPDAVPVKTP